MCGIIYKKNSFRELMKRLYFLAILTLLYPPSFSRAAGDPGSDSGSVVIVNPVGCGDFGCVADKIINSLLGIAIPIVAVMVLIGGFQIITAGGDPEKFKTGRKTVLYAVVGYAVILVAKGVRLIITSILTP